MKKVLFLIIVIAVISSQSFGQNQRQKEIDSLGFVLKTAKADTTKGKTLNALPFELIFTGLGILLLVGGLLSRLRYIRRTTAIIQKEKERSEALLLNILPAEIARELKEKGKADAKDFEEVSVLFADFEDFTVTSEKLSAQELVAEIHACFEAFDGIIGKYGIEKIKTIGDAYMAAGGLPIHFPDSVKNTVKAGLEMQEFMIMRKQKRETQGFLAFDMRLGIHTGPLVAGIVGVKKFQYDIWGDTVNVAARMEDNGEIRKVNISQSTFEFIKEDPWFYFEYRGKIEAKHKGELDMYFVAIPNHSVI
ncbi:MAG: adenylate/guanylate cyclase domain-containing protein [Bacteroidetes bacterium]|nr:adenylate/guanylate cyclase domain-containing protein [Bacteroidota bacterium]